MKFKIVLMTIFLSACTTPTVTTSNTLTFDDIRGFIVGSSTESDVVAKLGLPTTSGADGDYQLVSYDDPQTGFQRLSMSFSSETRKLSSLLWIPKENEKEYSLPQAQAIFKNAKFKEVLSGRKNPHALSLDAISYIDDKSGVTIRYNQNQKAVEAIAIYDASARIPASQNRTDQIPFTFGDERIISN